MLVLLLHLLLLCTTSAWASIKPLGTDGRKQPDLAALNAAITAQSTTAVAQGQPATWLVTFRTSQQQIEAQARAASAASGSGQPTAEDISTARLQVFDSIKSRVLGPAVTSPTAGLVAPEDAVAQPQGSLQVLIDYSHLPVTAVSISSTAELARLRAHPDVLSVTPDLVARTANTAAYNSVGQPAVTARGYVGAGGTAVIIDTGLDYTRPAFGPCTAPGVPAASCKVVYAEDLEGNDNQLDDPNQELHGTNVAGVITTVAPGVKFAAFDVFDAKGNAQFSTINKAINWAVANKAKYNITVINMSLGVAEDPDLKCDDWSVSQACNTAADAGVMSVAASGNAGDKQSILVPACAAKVVAVAAVYSTDVEEAGWTLNPETNEGCVDKNAKPDQITCFSNSNSKVALLAPGYEIEAAGTQLSGTSQATPFVAAAIAIVRSRFPSYTNDQVVGLLQSTGIPVKDAGNGLTFPRLNLRAAMGIACTPKLTPDNIKATKAGSSYTLTVTPPTPDCAWTVAAPGVTWMRTVGATSGKGPGTVALQVDAAVAAARSSGLVVTAADGSASALVSQAGSSVSVADTRPPVMGQLTVSSANSVVDLSWPASQDSQSGVSSYRVVYNPSSRPPSLHCTTGTLVSQQPQVSGSTLKLTVTGLSVGSQYTFRVCALDAAGNMAGGRMNRVTVSR